MFSHYKLHVKSLESIFLELEKKQLKIELKTKFESNKTLYLKELQIKELQKQLAESVEGHLELDAKFRKKTKELNKMKTNFAKCLEEDQLLKEENQFLRKENQFLRKENLSLKEKNQSFKEKCDALKVMISDYEGKLELNDLGTTKEDYESLKKQYEALQKSNDKTKRRLSKVTKNNCFLLSELNKKGHEIKKCEKDADACEVPKDKLNKLENELQDFTPDELVQKIAEINKNLDTLNKNCIILRDKMVKQIKSHNRTPCITTLETLLSDYEKSEKHLRKGNVIVSKRIFLENMKAYKDLCTKNDIKWKEIIKEAYHMPESINSIADKMKTGIFNFVPEIILSSEKLKQDFNTLSKITLTDDFDDEKCLYIKTINIARNEIFYRHNLSQVTDNFTSDKNKAESSSSQESTDDEN